MIASVFKNKGGKYSIKVHEQVLTSNPSPEDISLPVSKALEDLASIINAMDPPILPDFTQDDLPLEYNLVAMLDNYYGGIDWIYDDDSLPWFISCDPVFRVTESDYQSLDVFAPIRNYFDHINEKWVGIPPIPPEMDEYTALKEDNTNYVSAPIWAKMDMAYSLEIGPIKRVALNNLWMNTNESTMLCFSLIFGCCTVEEFAKGVVHMANLENEIPLNEQPKMVHRISTYTEKVLDWVDRNGE
jgi:hypothetical protein